MTTRSWNDLRIEVIIGALLRTGVILAAAVVLFGAVVYLARHGQQVASYGVFHGEPEALKSLTGIIHGALHMSGRAIIQLGLLLLIATPVARVAFSAVAFAIEGDYLYVWITLFVLGVLLYSLFGSQ
ncbi:MAG TPA: DUF1634 domain-containing protein [Terriglobales bacterium]|nr:DUF1634 domain-containing protein [Terriglobales bacterium]